MPSAAARDAPQPAPAGVARPRALLERDAELASIDRLLDDAERGAGRVVLIEGPPGIGKTRLLREGARRARDRELTVLAARGTQLERSFPFGIVHQLLDPVVRSSPPGERDAVMTGAATLAQPIFELSPAAMDASGDPSHAILHGLYWLIANFADRRPLFVAIDDAHWSDRPSGRLLEFLTPRLEGMPVSVAVASRNPGDSTESETLSAIARAPLERIRLAPLSERAVGRLVLERLGKEASETLSPACGTASGGIPFLVHELLEDLARQQSATDDLDPATVERLGPREVAAAALARVGWLSTAAGLARAVAVLGEDADLATAAALAELGPAEASASADALADAMILEPGRPLRFAHPIVRAAVYDAVPSAMRSDLHARAARLRAVDEGESNAVAAHLLETEPRGDAATVETLRRAAAAAVARGAPEPAVEFLRRALAEPPSENARPQVLSELGSSLVRVGDPSAPDTLREAFELAVTADARAHSGHELATALMIAGRAPAAVAVAEAALDELPDVDPSSTARLEGLLFGVAFVGVSGRRLVERRLRAVASEFTWSGDERSRLLAAPLAWERAVGPGGRAQAGATLAQHALADGRLLRQETAESTMALGAANALWVTGRYAQSEWALSALIAEAQERGSVRGFAVGTVNRAYGRYLRGWLREAEADAEAYSNLFVESRWPIFEPTAAAVLASVRLERGDLEGAQRSLAPLEQARDDDLGTMQFLNLARAAIALARGDNEEALANLELCRGFEESFRGGAGLACLVPWRSQAGLAHLSLGDSDTAGALAAEEVRLAREFGAGRPLGAALCVLATIEGGDRGIELLSEAVSVLETADSQVEHARALTDLGAALRRAGNRLEARERLTAGMDTAHRARATVIAHRARAELVAAGARPRRLAASGPDALTASERRVATMAVDGMGNREIAQRLFVTVRTVEGHLTNAFAKLEISSRDELGDSMAQAEATA